MKAIPHKIGDTFLAHCICDANDGTPVDMVEAGITVESRVLSPDGLTSFALVVEVLDQTTDPGRFNVSGASDEWPLGIAYWDLRYSQNNVSISTETYPLQLQERVS